MKEIIENILNNSSFQKIGEFSFGDLYENKEEAINYYWLVIQTTELTEDLVNTLQDEYFGECKKIVDSPSFNKNTSMLILYEADDSDLKKGLVQIVEENPYQFKKYVIPYSIDVSNELREKLNGEFSVNLKNMISDNSIFQEYKTNYDQYNWRHLMYTIAHKLPFLELQIEENQNIHNMDVMSEELIEQDNLTNYYEKLRSFFDTDEFKNIHELEFEDLLNKIKE